MRNNVLISIIISTFNKPWSILSTTLESIISSDFRDFEIILIDQNRNSNIEPALEENYKFKQITYLQSLDIGLSRGRNLGIKHAKGRWILFFDDDAILPGNTLNKIIDILTENRNNPLIYCGRVLIPDTGKPYLKKSAVMGKKISLINFDSVCSIALLFHKRIFDEIGLFDEAFGAGADYGAGEESDIILRALKKGYKIKKLDGFNVYHPLSDTEDLSKRKSYGIGTGALYRKHIFSSLSNFFILTLKLFAELILRVALIIRNLNSSGLRNYHLFYLQGYIKGFFSYNTRS